MQGSPDEFRCWHCRRAPGVMAIDTGTHVELTGKKRRGRKQSTHHRGDRSDVVEREYHCLDCGHRGWSNHIELKTKSRSESAFSEYQLRVELAKARTHARRWKALAKRFYGALSFLGE